MAKSDSVSAAASLRRRLKEGTRKQHRDTEARLVERAMLRGRLTLAQYTHVLAQRYLLHERLDSLLDRLTEERPEVRPLIGSDHRLAPFAHADLVRLGADSGQLQPLTSTKRALRWLQELAELKPMALIGPHYVFEGSKNGARYLRGGLLKAWGSQYADCLSYLDPHGARQPLLWARFSGELDRLRLSREEEDQIVAAAAGMFDGIAAIDDELQELFALSEVA